MGAPVRYIIRHNGRRMTLGAFANENGLPYETLRKRLKDNKNFCAPIARNSGRPPDEDKAKITGDSYSFEELAVLYKYFAGQENELRMVMDFACVGKGEAKELLRKLRENAEKNRKGYFA